MRKVRLKLQKAAVPAGTEKPGRWTWSVRHAATMIGSLIDLLAIRSSFAGEQSAMVASKTCRDVWKITTVFRERQDVIYLSGHIENGSANRNKKLSTTVFREQQGSTGLLRQQCKGRSCLGRFTTIGMPYKKYHIAQSIVDGKCI